MKSTESKSVQNPIIQYASEINWKPVTRHESDHLRDASGHYAGELYYHDILNAKLREFNPWLPASFKVPHFRPRIEGNREVLLFLRGDSAAFDEKENRNRNVKVIDFENPKNNIYQVTSEFYFNNGRQPIRQDIVFLINGIPVINLEAKNLTILNGIDKAIEENIRPYHKKAPELMTVEQLYAVSEGIRMEYSVTWNLVRRYIFPWKGDKIGELENKVKTFFDIQHVLNLIEKYIMFIEKDEQLSKIVLREHQASALEEVMRRALNEEATRGLIWHTQGSGKTYTMIKTAELLFKASEAEKPTVIMMLDRNELEDQMEKNLRASGLKNVHRAKNIADLIDILKSDYRGIVVTMIHKFKGLPANLNLRKNIYVLIDEAHRTTGGDLGTFMMAAIPNATFIGYTGTPVDKIQHGKGTFKTFGVDDVKGYLHKYSIIESIEDGTTLPLFYTLAPNEMLVPKETLEREFLNLAREHGVTDIEELNAILERAVNTKNFLKGIDRIEKVTKFIADHFKYHIDPMNYKAFLVGVDREACALYKKELDKYLPSEWSKVVYTSNAKDSDLLREFSLEPEKEKEVRRDFAKFGTNLKILIVTEKLLTGYDAPILYCMYLDKPMRDHTLLQTIARVNRPYENEEMKMVKPHGLVLDFVGIFDKLEKALSFDSEEVNAVVKDLSLLKEVFVEKINNNAERYLQLIRGPFDDKLAGVLIEHFRDADKRKTFFMLYNEVEMLYEIISPDAFLRPYLERYTTLSEMYKIVRNAYSKQVRVDREFQLKTAKLVQENIQNTPIRLGNKLVKLDHEGIELIKQSNQSDEVKIINLIKSIQKEAEEKANDPVLISIKERADLIKQTYEDRQLTTQEALKKLLELMESEAGRKEEQKNENISDVAWFIRDIMYPENQPEIKKGNYVQEEPANYSAVNMNIIHDLEAIVQKYPEFSHSEKLTREMRNSLYDRLEDFGVPPDDQKRIMDTIIQTLGRKREN